MMLLFFCSFTDTSFFKSTGWVEDSEGRVLGGWRGRFLMRVGFGLSILSPLHFPK